jgi:dTDP-glucose pyrophosphorylase
MNIVIPMAGLGSRFKNAGYELPKPLIDVMGKPMIQRVFENIDQSGNLIFIAQQSHPVDPVLERIANMNVPYSTKVHKIDGLTEGAACTVLTVKDLIDNGEELLIINSDQLVLDYKYVQRGLSYFRKNKLDGGLWSFLCKNPKWSYAEIGDDCLVTKVAEKDPISDIATVGAYYFKRGEAFVHCAHQMISKNIRVNGEFYTCPIYNELIGIGGKVGVYMVNEMVGLGTPEDLETYLTYYRDCAA